MHHYKLCEEMRKAEEQFSGLFFLGVDLGGVGVPDRIARAVEAAERMLPNRSNPRAVASGVQHQNQRF